MLSSLSSHLSTVREVPDHQEVFADVKTDQSVIVELVNMADATDDQAALFHFRELATDNDALSEAAVVNVERVGSDSLPNFSAGTVCYAVQGQQRVAKFNERTNAKNLVNIYLAVIRLPHKQVLSTSSASSFFFLIVGDSTQLTIVSLFGVFFFLIVVVIVN
jgi:hypothetical protein